MKRAVKREARCKVIVAIGQSDSSTIAMETALELVTAFPSTEVHLVHVIEPVAAAAPGFFLGPLSVLKDCRDLLEPLRQRFEAEGARAKTHVLTGDPASMILKLAASLDAALIIIGPYRRGQLAHLAAGSVSMRLVAEAPCPVYAARPRVGPAVVKVELHGTAAGSAPGRFSSTGDGRKRSSRVTGKTATRTGIVR